MRSRPTPPTAATCARSDLASASAPATAPGTFGVRILGVSEVTRSIRGAVRSDPRLADLWVEGEIGRVTISSAGHAYFALKDERNQLQCVWFRDERLRSAFEAQAGLRVVAHGRIDLFEPQGALQLYVESIQPAGLGDLTLRFEALKARLAAEGLFEAARKRPLPTRWPRSPTRDRPADRAWPDRHRRAQRLRQVESDRRAALGHGRDLGARMRGGEMDDVIFAGTGRGAVRSRRGRAPSTWRRSAPAGLGEVDKLQVSRRIGRGAGSAFRVNGRELRARDVQVLFADAASGARSAAIVSQGQVGALVDAKPPERRRLLEEAAGIGGLQARRHEAELRLKATEGNLARLSDLIGQLSSQLQALRRQARQAQRYREISGKIREAEALQHHLHWIASCALVEQEEAAFQAALATMAQETKAEGEALRQQAEAAEKLQPLRDAEAQRAAALHRLNVERDALEEEEARAMARQSELETRLAQASRDLAREEEHIAEAEGMLRRLSEEARKLEAQSSRDHEEPQLRASASTAVATLDAAEQALRLATTELLEARATRGRLQSERTKTAERLASLQQQAAELEQELAAHEAGASATRLAELHATLAELIATTESIEAELASAEAQEEAAKENEAQARAVEAAARFASQELETELATLTKVLQPAHDWAPIVEQIEIAAGYEQALGAALGDDLDAASDETAAAHWRKTAAPDADPALPDGAVPLSRFVTGPKALARRLAQIGVVDAARGRDLQAKLAPGQRLVSGDGDLWRWDGYSVAAGTDGLRRPPR